MGPSRYPQPCALPTDFGTCIRWNPSTGLLSLDKSPVPARVSTLSTFTPWNHPGAGLFVCVYPGINSRKGRCRSHRRCCVREGPTPASSAQRGGVETTSWLDAEVLRAVTMTLDTSPSLRESFPVPKALAIAWTTSADGRFPNTKHIPLIGPATAGSGSSGDSL